MTIPAGWWFLSFRGDAEGSLYFEQYSKMQIHTADAVASALVHGTYTGTYSRPDLAVGELGFTLSGESIVERTTVNAGGQVFEAPGGAVSPLALELSGGPARCVPGVLLDIWTTAPTVETLVLSFYPITIADTERLAGHEPGIVLAPALDGDPVVVAVGDGPEQEPAR
jgi:hypothetical protein